MSKVLNLRKSATATSTTTTSATITTAMKVMPSKLGGTEAGVAICTEPITNGHAHDDSGDAARNSIDFDDFTSSSSILEFLSKEQECCSEEDAESIFQEVSRLADNSDTRSVDEILREAELLIQKQSFLGGVGVAKTQVLAKSNGNNSIASFTKPKNTIKMNAKYTKKIENIRTTSTKVFDAGARPLPVLPTPTLGNTVDAPVSRSQSQASFASTTPLQTPTAISGGDGGSHFTAFVDNLPSESVLSEESTPKDLETFTATERHLPDDDTDDGTDTMEEITEAIETIELVVNEEPCSMIGSNGKSETISAILTSSSSASISSLASAGRSQSAKLTFTHATGRRPPLSRSESPLMLQQQQMQDQLASPMRRPPLNFNATQACSIPLELPRGSSVATARRASVQTPDSGFGSQTQSTQTPRDNDDVAFASAAPLSAGRSYCDKSTNSSPKHMVSSVTSPIESMAAITREHALKHDIELLQEKLKDTEERLQSLRIQHDSLSQLHRDLRESNTHLQEESEMLKLDVQHLNECANVLRSELQSSRHDRNEALELQKVLQTELDESRQDKKRAQEQKEKDTKIIQDLQRQCREMERILMRKHPDSVSALIVASKNPGKLPNNDQENLNSRRLLEQRIAQLESDAKEQDAKAQQILANVQARFNSVQSKYETHIADLETQVLSLQEINTKLNEKIESQVRTLDYFVTKKAEKYYNNCTQTEDILVAEPVNSTSVEATELKPRNSAATQTAKASTRDHSTNTIASTTSNISSHPHSASSSTSSTANSTPNNSRPNSKQSGLRKPIASASGSLSSALASKLPVSQSDSTISLSSYHAAAKEDAHLLATIRGMRVDLAIKDKAMQRLSRELDECKKTIRKLQKDASKSDKLHCGPSSASTSRRSHDVAYYTPYDQTPANTESQALKEAQNKIKLLEADYKSLHDKRLQDLKTLQSAHERELSSCHETVRILQQRLNERDEAFAMQKRRKVPVDYYALKAKVSSLERRHSEREERLHMLVEALSKGRLNGALGDLLSDNNNQ